ncbi:MAG: hypothetical protein R3Y29_05690 [bacterium]
MQISNNVNSLYSTQSSELQRSSTNQNQKSNDKKSSSSMEQQVQQQSIQQNVDKQVAAQKTTTNKAETAKLDIKQAEVKQAEVKKASTQSSQVKSSSAKSQTAQVKKTDVSSQASQTKQASQVKSSSAKTQTSQVKKSSVQSAAQQQASANAQAQTKAKAVQESPVLKSVQTKIDTNTDLNVKEMDYLKQADSNQYEVTSDRQQKASEFKSQLESSGSQQEFNQVVESKVNEYLEEFSSSTEPDQSRVQEFLKMADEVSKFQDTEAYAQLTTETENAPKPQEPSEAQLAFKEQQAETEVRQEQLKAEYLADVELQQETRAEIVAEQVELLMSENDAENVKYLAEDETGAISEMQSQSEQTGLDKLEALKEAFNNSSTQETTSVTNPAISVYANSSASTSKVLDIVS